MSMRRALVGVAVVLLLPLAPPAHGNDISPDVWRSYRQAILDASTPDKDEVVRDLLPLARKDPRVRWRMIDGRRHVLVTTLRRNALGDPASDGPVRLSGDKWVFLPRQLRIRCRALGCRTMKAARLDLRLKQLIGLPPDADYSVVNSLWVRPRDMFRPCRDPDVRATSCPRRASAPLPDSLRYFLWEQAAYAWRLPAQWDPATAVSCAGTWPEPSNCMGFPWTRLGYTYDWGNRHDEVGLTEFVVAGGAEVHLHRVEGQRSLVS